MTRDEIQKVRGALVAADNAILSVHGYNEALDILGRALAAPEPEPVAWQERRAIYRKGGVKWSEWYPCDYTSKQVAAARESTPSDEYEWRPLFAAPPSREWQELSPLEMRDTLRNCAASTFDKLAPHWYEVRQFARAIESALRAKNSGASHAEKDALQDAINSIYVYANDTLSGRTDGPDDRAWYRAGIVELRNRARALATIGGAVAARAALRKKNSGEQA